jgi:ribonuclease P protein component
MLSNSLKKKERIHKKEEFLQILREGERYKTKHFKVMIKENHLDRVRLGLIVSKKIGNAVKRNSIKRLLREFFRINKSFFPLGSDILFIAKPADDSLNYSKVDKEFKELFFNRDELPDGSPKNFKSVS